MLVDAPYPPPFPLHTGRTDKAASAALITPSKNSATSNMEEDAVIENGSSLVATGGAVDDPMDDIVADPDPPDNEGDAGGKDGNGTDDPIDVDLDDEDGGEAGTGAGKDVIDVDREDKDGGDEGTGAGKDGAEAGSGVMDATGSLIVPTNNKDKDDMSVNDADTEAAKNTLANTTGTKSISLLNAKGVAYIWSQSDRIPRTAVSASVATLIWRKVKSYKSPAEIEKAVGELLPEVWASSSPSLEFSSSLSVSDLTEFISTIAQKQQPWMKGARVLDLYTLPLSLSKTSPEVFGPAWTTKGELLPSPVTTIWAAANKSLGSC